MQDKIIEILINIILFIAGNACLYLVSSITKMKKDLDACFQKIRNLEKEIKNERD